MAFKPVVIEKEINGKVFKAQFNGVSTMYRAQDESEGKAAKMTEFLFKNVLVEPKIKDIDEFFGTNVKMMNEVIEFAADVMNADEKYFPKNDEDTAGGKSKK